MPEDPFIGFDKVAHAGVYAILCILVARAIFSTGKAQLPRSIIYGIIFAACYGAIDEWHQSFTEGRVTDIYDLLADVFGACCCLSLLWLHKINPRLITWAT
jgi:VanZ family protein